MARTSASRGKKGYTPRSGKSPVFKMMGSSPARKPDKDKITWNPEQKVSEKTTETDASTDVTTTYETTGTSKGFTPHSTPGEAFTNWKKKNPSGTEDEFIKLAEEWRESQKKTHKKSREEVATTPKPESKPEPKTPETEEKEGKMCHCKGIQQNEPGASGSVTFRSWEKYLCDGPVHPNCLPPSGKGKGGRNILTGGSSSNTASEKSRE
jgi:hypothetical protein